MTDTQTDGFKWYAVRTLANQELKVKRFIEQACEAGTLKDCVKQVLVPTKTVLEVKNRKKTSRTAKLFPGFMGGDNRPVPMKPSEAEALLGQAEESQGKKVLKAGYEVGGKVKVIDGAFVGSSAVIDEVDAEKLHELLEDEFNLPVDFEFVVDYHWDLGHGWSEELL